MRNVPIKWQITLSLGDGNGSGEEDDGIALHRLQREAYVVVRQLQNIPITDWVETTLNKTRMKPKQQTMLPRV